MGTEHLHKSRYDNINDEFYTKYEDVASELMNYDFEGKRVFCPCDTEDSAFVQYFKTYFRYLRLRLLSYTYLGAGGIYNYNGIKTTFIATDCDSCRDASLLGSFDIVVTNPPFSIAREYYIPALYKYNKKFLIVGDLNWVAYKDVFPLFQSNQIWFGVNNIKKFLQPNGTVEKFGNKLWYTNLDHVKRHSKINCYRKYNESEYIKYDNYDAIECCPTSTIPVDYNGIMGVPTTYLIHHNPDQFEIVGIACGWNTDMTIKTYNKNQIQHTWDKSSKSFKYPIKVAKLNDGCPAIRLDIPYTNATYYEIDGEFYARKYFRIFIRRR